MDKEIAEYKGTNKITKEEFSAWMNDLKDYVYNAKYDWSPEFNPSGQYEQYINDSIKLKEEMDKKILEIENSDCRKRLYFSTARKVLDEHNCQAGKMNARTVYLNEKYKLQHELINQASKFRSSARELAQKIIEEYRSNFKIE